LNRLSERGLQEGEVFVEACGVRLKAVIDAAPVGMGEGIEAGDSVLVLHGFTGSAESMEVVSATLRDHFRVIRLELIGHGGSESPKESRPYAMEACAEQILEIVRALSLERPHLLGYSMGGRAAIAAAVADPQRFSSLVLVGATAGIADPVLREERVAADRLLADRIESIPLAEFVDEWMALPIFASQSRLGESALKRARDQRLANERTGLANSLRGMGAGAQRPLFDRLEKIEAPVLLVVGEADEKFRDIAALLETRLRDARTEIVSDVGHAVHLEAPETFGKLVAEFMAGVTDRDRARLTRIRNGASDASRDRG